MRAVIAILIAVFILPGTILAAEPLKEVQEGTSPAPTGQVLLDQLSSERESDHQSALGYIMGVLAVHSGKGTLPPMKEQEEIAKIVKQSLEVRQAALTRPASELLKEVYDADKGRLHALME